MASGAPGSESHTLLAQSRGQRGPSPSCTLPRPGPKSVPGLGMRTLGCRGRD